MRIFTLPHRDIDAFGSTGVAMDFLPRVLDAGRSDVHVARLVAGGTIGPHTAVRRQLFAVVDGEAEVVADGGRPWPVHTGQVVLWEPGEDHQTWARGPMVAVIIETTGELELGDHFEEVDLTADDEPPS